MLARVDYDDSRCSECGELTRISELDAHDGVCAACWDEAYADGD